MVSVDFYLQADQVGDDSLFKLLATRKGVVKELVILLAFAELV
jgi:hypothetical protein